MNNQEKILQYLKKHQASVVELVDYLEISRQATHKILSKLLDQGTITKIGKAPSVYYILAQQKSESPIVSSIDIDDYTRDAIDRTFLHVTPFGQRRQGWQGFIWWCNERGLDAQVMARRYVELRMRYDKYREGSVVNGYDKFKITFGTDVALDEVFYVDFYSIEIFGKTKLGQLLLFAKQSQDVSLMNELIDSIQPAVMEVMERFSIDGVVFVPPTVQRKRQLMQQLEKRLSLSVRSVSAVKVKTPIVVPQKTLSKLEDRIINAKETIIVTDNSRYQNILIIDDAVGSGATLNEIAKKIRAKELCSGKIVGLAITGSAKGFDVISEV